MDTKQRLKDLYDEGIISPYEAARIVLGELTPEDYLEVLEITIPIYAREVLRTRRTMIRKTQGEIKRNSDGL